MGLFEFARRQDDTTTGSTSNFGCNIYGSDSGVTTGSASTDCFLDLIANPFQAEVQSTSFYAALGWSFGLGSILFLLFCVLRPRVSWIYAPRARHADAKHAPPAVSDDFFGWWPTLKAVKEQELVDKIGLDATIFLRFVKMTRNIFAILSVIGLAILIPATLIDRSSTGSSNTITFFIAITPQYVYGQRFWAWVVIAYVFTGIIYFFLWRNYRVILQLRRTYLESEDYRSSLHSRTLIVQHIPQSSRNEEGIIQLMQEAKPVEALPNAAIARNVQELPELIEQHEDAVQELEKVLAKYLSNPDRLPTRRPMMKPFKNDLAHSSGHEVDAIDYLTSRISQLEHEVNQLRESVDRRNPLPYGFASYTYVEDAHSVAYAARKKGPQGTTIQLAPKPHDLIWKNLPLSRTVKRNRTIRHNLWMVLLTILYIPPNVLIAVFLANLHNLALVWPKFQVSLEAHPVGWGIAQGIVAPGIQLLFFFFLPTIFRRLLIKSGDPTKTARERHVTSKLYAFYFFNKIFVFSVFAAAWAFTAAVIKAKDTNVWDAIKEADLSANVVIGLCNISPFWITTQLQAYLGSAADIIQAWPLIWNVLVRKFSNPTPRQLVELTAPQKFEYSSYYSNYLVICTVGMVFGTLQPLILPVTAIYLMIEAWFKKYLLQYVFITKIESGGSFWQIVFNRMLFATLVMDAVIALLVGAKGDATMVYVMIPLIPILIGFKWYCVYSFDTEYNYYSTRSFTESEVGPSTTAAPARKSRRSADRVGVRFGHPALYKKLMTPMVLEKSQHLLRQVYRGRLGSDDNGKNTTSSRPNSMFGYSDIYMTQMSAAEPGKAARDRDGPFEVVRESQLDFEHFKRRADFRDSYGGEGELYGRAADDMTSRPGTPSSMMSFGAASTLMGTHDPRSRSESPATRNNKRPGSSSRPTTGMGLDGETTYARGYAGVPVLRDQSPGPVGRTGGAHVRDFSGSGTLSNAETIVQQQQTQYATQRPGYNLPRLSSVDIPDAGLDRHEIADAGLEAYHDDEPFETYAPRRLSQGSIGGMLQNAARMGRSPSPPPRIHAPSASADMQQGRGRVARKPVRSSGYEYVQTGSGTATPPSGIGSGSATPRALDDGFTSYDYFRRGK